VKWQLTLILKKTAFKKSESDTSIEIEVSDLSTAAAVPYVYICIVHDRAEAKCSMGTTE